MKVCSHKEGAINHSLPPGDEESEVEIVARSRGIGSNRNLDIVKQIIHHEIFTMMMSTWMILWMMKRRTKT